MFNFVDILKVLVLFLGCGVSIYSMFIICHKFDNVTFNTFDDVHKLSESTGGNSRT